MELKHVEEWAQLQTEAIERLREGVYHQGYRRQLQALVLPSFDDSCSYELLVPTPRNGGFALAVETIWKRLTDVAKFKTPVERLKHGIGVQLRPTIEERTNTIALDVINGLVKRTMALRVPPHVPSDGIGLDGVTYEILFVDSFTSARFQWWVCLPAGWEPLQELFEEIKAVVIRDTQA